MPFIEIKMFHKRISIFDQFPMESRQVSKTDEPASSLLNSRLAGSRRSGAYRLLCLDFDGVLRAGKEGLSTLWLLGSSDSPDMWGRG